MATKVDELIEQQIDDLLATARMTKVGGVTRIKKLSSVEQLGLSTAFGQVNTAIAQLKSVFSDLGLADCDVSKNYRIGSDGWLEVIDDQE